WLVARLRDTGGAPDGLRLRRAERGRQRADGGTCRARGTRPRFEIRAVRGATFALLANLARAPTSGPRSDPRGRALSSPRVSAVFDRAAPWARAGKRVGVGPQGAAPAPVRLRWIVSRSRA